MDCPTCACLGFRPAQFTKKVSPSISSTKSIGTRSWEALQASAADGCKYCSVAIKALVLSKSAASRPILEIRLYSHSPTELHSKPTYDVVEVWLQPTTIDAASPNCGRIVPATAKSDISMTFLRHSFESCCQSHLNCRQENTPLPKRVIDVSTSQFRLIEPDTGTQGRYAALSYSWGGKVFFTTVSANYDSLRHGIDEGLMPIAFRDAAFLARTLDIRYLWIDALCIVQDSRPDWEEQVITMGDIFEQAALTIAASSSPHPGVSIFENRDMTHREVELPQELGSESLGSIFRARRKITRGHHAKSGWTTESDPLDSRAWALQERILPIRLISFTGAELQWKCRTQEACECRESSYVTTPFFPLVPLRIGVDDPNAWFQGWTQAVEEYSSRSLTQVEDKLPALSGLARKFSDLTGFTYIAGHWKENLCADLVWQRHTDSFDASISYLAPSWSWASRSGAVNFRFARHSYPGERTTHLDIVEFEYTTVSGSIYSRPLGGLLTVRGKVLTAVLQRWASESQSYSISIDGATYMTNTNQRCTCEFSIDEPKTHQVVRSGMADQNSSHDELRDALGESFAFSVKLLGLNSIHHRRYLYQNFLILRKLLSETELYERIGVGTGKIYYDDPNRNGGQTSNPPDPFEWLSVDLKAKGSFTVTALDQVIDIC